MPTTNPDHIFVTPLAADADETGFPRTEWRLIIEDEARSGAVNMALDQALAESAAAGSAPPALRFYRWDPPAVSLGRHQPLADIDQAAVAARGFELVRRPTGGRAILHIDELTYSVAAPTGDPRVAGGVMDAYLRLSNALVAGLHTLGLAAAEKAPAATRAGADVSAACFEVPSAYEITAGGRKLMGSAQSRRAGYVLQHGSLPLRGDVARLVDLLVLPEGQAEQLRRDLHARACTLSEALAAATPGETAPIRFDTVAAYLAGAFAAALNLDLAPSQPTPVELRRTAELVRIKFAAPEWTTSR